MMTKMKKMQFVCVMAVIAMAGVSQAAVTIYEDNSWPYYETDAIAGIANLGSHLAGMKVQFIGSGGAVNETETWGDLGAGFLGGGYYGVQGTGWDLYMLGSANTATAFWTFDATNFESLVLDAGFGSAVFDIKELATTPPSTVGSSSGLQFTTSETPNWDVTYSGPVALTGDAPVGDLYRQMEITNLGGGIGYAYDSFELFKFQADTDEATTGLTPVVPVPGALLLASLGSGAVSLLRRRQWV